MFKLLLTTYLLTFSIFCYASTNKNSPLIIVGEKGTILSSSDGISWTAKNSPTTKTIYSIIHANNEYLAIAYDGDAQTVLKSPDATIWTQKEIYNFTFPYESIIWSNNQYMISGVSSWGTIYTSPDGLKWTERYLGYPINYGVVAVSTHPTPIYIAAGGHQGPHECISNIITSSDGLKWERVNQDFMCMYPVIWGKNEFIAIGTQGGYLDEWTKAILTSSDGKNWEQHPLPEKYWIGSMAWGNNTYVAFGGKEGSDANLILTSPDGIHWKTQSLGQKYYSLKVFWIHNQFLIIGDKGTILTSSDGIQWTTQHSGTTSKLYDVCE